MSYVYAGEHGVRRADAAGRQPQRGRLAEGRGRRRPGTDGQISSQAGEGRAVRRPDDVTRRGT